MVTSNVERESVMRKEKVRRAGQVTRGANGVISKGETTHESRHKRVTSLFAF